MSKSDVFENDLLKLILNGTAIAGIADNAASSPVTQLYLSLHTADPGEAGTQSTSEVTYTGYARAAVSRSASGWTVTGGTANLTSAVSFPIGSGGGGTAMFFAVGTAASGAGKVLYTGVIGTVQGPFTAATSGTFTAPGHSLVVDDRVAFFPVPGSALPGGVTEGALYWVKTVASDTFTIAASQGGTAVTITAAGDGLSYRNAGIICGAGVTPMLGVATTITED